MSVSKAVLITGCSSGIGRATAERLVAGGWKVYATARNVDSISDLAGRGCEVLPLDVTDEGSMRAAVGEVEEREGAVGVLVNNAGYSQSGAVEEVSMEKVRRQFETNVFGLMAVTRAVLPHFRAQRDGVFVNVDGSGQSLYTGQDPLQLTLASGTYQLKDPTRGNTYTTDMNNKTDSIFCQIFVPAVNLFMLVRVVNAARKPAPAAPAPPAPTPEDVLLLREIRDSLKR